MSFWGSYFIFLLKCITVTVMILVIISAFSSDKKKGKKIDVRPLNDEHTALVKLMTKAIGQKFIKPKKSKIKPASLYVLHFDGDVKASQVSALRQEITALLSVIKPDDEVVIKLESPGGTVNGYGLAAAELQRLKERNIPLTVCIDKVAASGGYLMACLANQIIAAPFAIIGSIGVVAQMPNFHRWLKDHHIDVELITAGEYKRTLTVFGENTEKGREKFKADLEKIHDAFRNFVLQYRGNLDIEEVATGEHWLALDALKLKLIDKIQTSDDFILSKLQTHRCFEIKAQTKTSLVEKVLQPATKLLHPFG